MEIRRFDPASAADVDRWLAVDAAGHAHDVPDFPEPCREDFSAGLVHPWPGTVHERWLALEGERAVGILDLGLPQLDNLENAEVELRVLPGERRRGVGRELYRRAVDVARGDGRRWLIGEVGRPLVDEPGVVAPGVGFAAAVGARTANTEVRRRVDLDSVDDSVLEAMLVGARAKAEGYSLRRWVGSAPEDVVDGIAALDSSFVGEAPMGDLVYEDEKVDAARIRANEASSRARGRRMYHVVACHDATGEVVAWTTVGLNHCPDDHGWQQITLVAPKHRGHRLGLWTKLDNLAQVREREPALRVLNTWNAQQNDHMIAINEAMGFRPVDAWDAVQVAL
jgi:GNAT superfamily N-acetyltransferase